MSPLVGGAVCLALLGFTAAPIASAAVPTEQRQLDPAQREIWRSVWTWEARGRGDLARAALEKLLRARPNDVELMLEVALIELRANRVAAAQDMRARLQAAAPGHPVLAELDTAIRVLGRERVRLASVRRLQEVSRHEEALAELRALFPEGPPRHTLGLEYWRLVADAPDGWPAARDGMETLVAAHPTDPRYELALAEHLTRRASTRPEGLRRLLALGARADLRRDQLIAAWRRALDRASVNEVTPAMLRRYAALAPDDAEAQLWAQAGGLPRRAASAPDPAPSDPDLRRGRSLLAQGDAERALPRFEQAAQRDAASLAAAQGRVASLIALGRHDDAVAVAERLRAAATDARAKAALRADALAARARARLERGERSLALRDFEAAIASAPDDPWLRFDLAREYATLGVADEAEALMREALARQPQSADARFAVALLLESLDRETEALDVLASVPVAQHTDGMRALEARARIAVARMRAADQLAVGNRVEAERALAAAEPYAREAGAVEALARGWIEAGSADRALALVERAGAQRPDELALQLARVRVLAASDREDDYAAALRELRARSGLSAEVLAEIEDRQRALELEQLARLRRDGDAEAALAAADAWLLRRSDAATRDALLRERATALMLLQRSAEAAPVYADLVERNPADADLRLDYADALDAASERAAARVSLRAALARSGTEDVGLRLAVARRLRAHGDLDDAAALLAALRQQAPQDAAVLEESGWLYRARGDDAAARAFFAVAAARAPEKAALADALAAIDARRQGWISAGFDLESKPGDAGISDMWMLQLPVEWRLPQGYDGHWFGQIDRVHLDVGRLPADYDAAALYGTVQARGPQAVDDFPNGFEPHARGTALGIGYENERLRIDIGTTPLGFGEEDIVGGLRLYAQSGTIDWSLDLARRAVTSSLVAYAGARDPGTERIWGGVRRNGASLRGAYYGARHSLSLTLDAARFEGRNVPDNEYAGARTAYDWRLFDSGADRVFIGMAASYWNYQRNQRFYTYGHGGYYSPQSYLNVSLPLQWQGARGRWSYELFAAASHSESDEDSVAFYPTDPALQAQAQASPLPSGFNAPVHDGGGGSGSGYSLRAAFEYRLDPRWALGARAALDRSDYYEPDFFTLYVRRVFHEAGGVLRDPPRPPRSYAAY